MSDYSASLTIPDHFRRQFSATWDSVLQQRNQRFANAGRIESSWSAKEFVWHDLDKIEAVETTGQRFGDSNPTDVSGGARKGYQRQFDVAIKRDQWDQKFLDQWALPDSDIVMEMKSGLNRKLDDVWLDAAVADALGGADPYNTAIPLPNSSKVPVNYILGGTGSNSGLTPYKLLEATKRFAAAEVDLDQEELWLAISPQQRLELVSYVAQAPNEVWARIVGKWLEDSATGKPAKLMGYNVIESNRIQLDSATDIRTCVAFTKSAFKVSPITQRLQMDVIPTKRHALWIQSYLSFGAVRVVDAKVQLIYCDQSP